MAIITKEQRREHVAAMRASSALEDMHADAQSRALEEQYIEGTASLEDLLKHAKRCADERRIRQDAVEFARASVGLEGFVPSEAAVADARRLVNSEITLANFVRTECGE